MLSAVAVRKARQQLQQQAIPSSAPVSPPPSPLPEPTKPKRRFQDDNATLPKRGKKRKSSKPKKPFTATRYFEPASHQKPKPLQDAFAMQEDVIIVPSDEDSGDLVMDGSGLEIQTHLRGMGPPFLIPDSSDEELDMMDEDKPIPGSSKIKTQLHFPPSSPLSNVALILDKNMIYLTQPEKIALNLPDTPSTLLVLPPDGILSLMGTYKMTIYRGSISFSNVILSATPHPRTHRVFSPRSAAIPAIHVLPSGPESQSTLLPNRIRPFVTEGCAVVVISELRTGIEGLGKVCRAFEGVFELPKWERSAERPDIGFPGVHIVRYVTHTIIAQR